MVANPQRVDSILDRLERLGLTGQAALAQLTASERAELQQSKQELENHFPYHVPTEFRRRKRLSELFRGTRLQSQPITPPGQQSSSSTTSSLISGPSSQLTGGPTTLLPPSQPTTTLYNPPPSQPIPPVPPGTQPLPPSQPTTRLTSQPTSQLPPPNLPPPGTQPLPPTQPVPPSQPGTGGGPPGTGLGGDRLFERFLYGHRRGMSANLFMESVRRNDPRVSRKTGRRARRIGRVLGELGQIGQGLFNAMQPGEGSESGEIGSMLGTAGDAATKIPGPAGLAAAALLKLSGAAFKAVEGVRRWGDNLLTKDFKVGEFSPQMRMVQTRERMRKIFLSRQRGARRAKAAEELSQAKYEFEKRVGPIDDLYSNLKKRLAKDLFEGGSRIYDTFKQSEEGKAAQKIMEGMKSPMEWFKMSPKEREEAIDKELGRKKGETMADWMKKMMGGAQEDVGMTTKDFNIPEMMNGARRRWSKVYGRPPRFGEE